MKIKIAQINSKIGAITENLSVVLKEIHQTRACDLIVFPEMVLLGYPAYDLLNRLDIKLELESALTKIQEASNQYH